MTDLVTPLDLEGAVNWMTARWPSAHRDWSDWQSLHSEFAGFTKGALKESLRAWYDRGERAAPNSSQLKKLVKETQARRVQNGVDTIQRDCGGAHVWADPHPLDDDRRRQCVLCDEYGTQVACDPHHYGRSGRCVYCLTTKPETTVETNLV